MKYKCCENVGKKGSATDIEGVTEEMLKYKCILWMNSFCDLYNVLLDNWKDAIFSCD